MNVVTDRYVHKERERHTHTRPLTICDARMGPTLGTHVTCSEFYSSRQAGRQAGRQHGRKEKGRKRIRRGQHVTEPVIQGR